MNTNENILDKWLDKNLKNKQQATPNKKQKLKTFFKKNFSNSKLKLVFLGGLDETGGKNMMAIEYKNDIIVIDMGLMFPPDDMLGVDYIVPDSTYLEKNKHKIKGILVTHGHLDHIGAISYILPKLNNPKIYSLKLTNGFIANQLKEYKLNGKSKLIDVKPRTPFTLGSFKITFFRVNHSISDSCGIIIDTKEGKIVHTGDFKFDETPADGLQADYKVLEELGKSNVLLMMCESTNANRPGHTVSEKVIGETLDSIITNTKGRLVIACTSSLIGRMQQIIDSAKKNKRKIFVSGRSMIRNIETAYKLGYIKYPEGLIQQLKKAGTQSHKANALILTTGSQGEPLAALTRMAFNEHAHLKIIPSDTIVFSSSPIVGNEKAVTALLNEIARTGANIITNKHMDVHTTGHGNLEDLKRMINYIRPKYLVPVHGEYYYRSILKQAAIELGIKKDNILLLNDSEILEIKNKTCHLSKEQASNKLIMVDNQTNTLSSIANHLIQERQSMGNNGIIIFNITIRKKTMALENVNTQSHGFIYMNQSSKILKILNTQIEKHCKTLKTNTKITKTNEVEKLLKKNLERYLQRKLHRKPLITPIVNFV